MFLHSFTLLIFLIECLLSEDDWRFKHDKNVSLGPSWRVVVFHRRDTKVFGVAGET